MSRKVSVESGARKRAAMVWKRELSRVGWRLRKPKEPMQP